MYILVILAEILETLTTCENALNLEDAKSKAGNDMLKVMQYVYPIVVSTQMDIIKRYGLPEGREGKKLKHMYSTSSIIHTNLVKYKL